MAKKKATADDGQAKLKANGSGLGISCTHGIKGARDLRCVPCDATLCLSGRTDLREIGAFQRAHGKSCGKKPAAEATA